MNDSDLKNLEQQLERATASDSPTDVSLGKNTVSLGKNTVPLDEDTQALRETWLSFASLLETTQAVVEEPFELQLPPVRPNRRRMVGLVVLAVSLLAAIALGWHLLGSGGTSSPTVPSKKIARPDPKPPQPAKKQQAVAKLDGSQLDWDDSLDQQLVSAGREMVRVQQDWHGLNDAFGPLQHGLERMRKEIKNSPL